MLEQVFFLGKSLEALIKNEINNTSNLSVLVPSLLEVVFMLKTVPKRKKLFSVIQAEISCSAAIANDQATSREKYNSQILLTNI